MADKCSAGLFRARIFDYLPDNCIFSNKLAANEDFLVLIFPSTVLSRKVIFAWYVPVDISILSHTFIETARLFLRIIADSFSATTTAEMSVGLLALPAD